MLKAIDAHMHLPAKTSTPIEDFSALVNTSELAGFVLILNQQEEQTLVFNNSTFLVESDKFCAVALLASPALALPLHLFSHFQAQDIPCFLKLHPRLSGIEKTNFKQIGEMVQKAPAKAVIIDDFIYGHRRNTHVGLDLSIYLAELCPEKTFVIAHAGGIHLLETMLSTRTLPNIMLDLSFTCNYLLQSSVQADMVYLLHHDSHRVMFGSDFPAYTPMQAVEEMTQLFRQAQLTPQQIHAVLFENAHRLFFSEEI